MKTRYSARSLYKAGEEVCRDIFANMRWGDGGPSCPSCGGENPYILERRRFACRDCRKQFTETTGTVFHSRKMSFADLMAAISMMADNPKGMSSLQMSRNLECSQKTAYVLMQKIRAAMRGEIDGLRLSGEVELDGGYFLGYMKQRNIRRNVQGRMQRKFWSGKRRCVIIVRERGGRAKTFVEVTESAGVARAIESVEEGSTIYADGARHWNSLAALFEMRRINHSLAYAIGNTHTNWAESYFARLRRMIDGQHHRSSPEHLREYAAHAAWLENHRHESHERRMMTIVRLCCNGKSSEWSGYWQKRGARGQQLEAPKWGYGHSREFHEKREAWAEGPNVIPMTRKRA